MRNEGHIEIDRPIASVFERTLDHVSEWSQIVVEDRVIEEKAEGVGTTFVTVTEEHGKRMEFQGVITRYEAPFVSAIHLTGEMFNLVIEYEFEDLGSGTRVTQRSDVEPKGWFKVFLFLFGWMMRRSNCAAMNDELERLKNYCEETIPE